MYFEQICPIYVTFSSLPSLLPAPPFSVFTGFHCTIFIYIYIFLCIYRIYTYSMSVILIPCHLSFPLLLPAGSPTPFTIMSCYYTLSGLGSTYKWKHDTCLSVLGLPHLLLWSPVAPISSNFTLAFGLVLPRVHGPHFLYPVMGWAPQP
jgi:hypothetical protein